MDDEVVELVTWPITSTGFSRRLIFVWNCRFVRVQRPLLGLDVVAD